MKPFHTKKEVVKTEIIPFTVSQLSKIMYKEKPSAIYNGQWSTKTPFLIITEYNIKGFMMYCPAWADKNPQQYNPEKLHSMLLYQGLSDCYIK